MYDPRGPRFPRLRRSYRYLRTRRQRGPKRSGKLNKLLRGAEKAVPFLAGAAAFFSASKVWADYSNQVQRGQLGNQNLGNKLKWLVGMTVYRAGQAAGQNWLIFQDNTGIYNFPQQGTVGFGFKPWGALNSITIGSGIALAAVHFLPGIPRANLIKKAATQALIWGAIGGSLDPTAGKGGQATGSPGVLASSGPARQGAQPLGTAYGGGRSAGSAPMQIAGVAAVN